MTRRRPSICVPSRSGRSTTGRPEVQTFPTADPLVVSGSNGSLLPLRAPGCWAAGRRFWPTDPGRRTGRRRARSDPGHHRRGPAAGGVVRQGRPERLLPAVPGPTVRTDGAVAPDLLLHRTRAPTRPWRHPSVVPRSPRPPTGPRPLRRRALARARLPHSTGTRRRHGWRRRRLRFRGPVDQHPIQPSSAPQDPSPSHRSTTRRHVRGSKRCSSPLTEGPSGRIFPRGAHRSPWPWFPVETSSLTIKITKVWKSGAHYSRGPASPTWPFPGVTFHPAMRLPINGLARLSRARCQSAGPQSVRSGRQSEPRLHRTDDARPNRSPANSSSRRRRRCRSPGRRSQSPVGRSRTCWLRRPHPSTSRCRSPRAPGSAIFRAIGRRTSSRQAHSRGSPGSDDPHPIVDPPVEWRTSGRIDRSRTVPCGRPPD